MSIKIIPVALVKPPLTPSTSEEEDTNPESISQEGTAPSEVHPVKNALHPTPLQKKAKLQSYREKRTVETREKSFFH